MQYEEMTVGNTKHDLPPFLCNENVHEKKDKASQLAWTNRNLKQLQTYVTQAINQIKKRLDMDSILRKERSQWWENVGCLINCMSSI